VRDISCSVQVCTDIVYSTTIAGKSPFISYTTVSALGTDLGSHERIHISNANSDSLCLVSDKLLQLIETPSVNFCSALTSYVLACSDSVQVFQNNFCYVISDTIRDDFLAYVVVSPSSKPLFSAGNCSEQFLTATSAFDLKCASKESVFSIYSVAFFGCVESTIAADSSVSYSQVYSNSSGSRIRVRNSSIVFEAEHKPMVSMFINSEQSFFDFPRSEILSVAIRNSEWQGVAFVDSSQMQSVLFNDIRVNTDSCCSWKIISDTCSAYDRFSACLLYYSTRLFDAAYGKLSRQCLSEFAINMGVQFDVILDAESPCGIGTQLQSSFVSDNSFVECNILWQFDSGCCEQGVDAEYQLLYKANQSHGGVKSEFLFSLKREVSFAYAL
jgi:hypothetical protein